MVTPSFSLFAFSGMLEEMAALLTCRLLLPQVTADLSILGSEADRAARNRLQNRWIANRLLQWLQSKSEVKLAPGAVPQGAFVVRDGDAVPEQVLLGSLAFTTDGLGLTPGNPLNLIQASETPEEALLLSKWFDAQWSGLAENPMAKRELIGLLQSLASHKEPFLVYSLILYNIFRDRDEDLESTILR